MDYNCEKKVYDMYSAFLNEYSQATVGLSRFYETVISFFSDGFTNTEETDSTFFERNLRSIQDVCFFLKTFCSEIELHAQFLKSKTKDKLDLDDLDVIEEQLETVDIEYKLPENPNEIFPFEVYPEIFTYKSIDPAEFKVGHEGEFFVSFVKDDTNCLFFMMKSSCSDIVIEQPEFRYDVIPSKGTVFGLLLDGKIFRAVRENSLKSQPKSIRVLLIDLGEIVEITKDYKMYRLTEEIQQNPGQSIFCKLTMTDDDSSDNEARLQHKLYSKRNVRIDRVYKNMLEVTFIPSASAHSTLAPSKSNLQMLPDGKATESYQMGTHSTCNTFNDWLTQDELDELNEEPFTTENALEAMTGYIPQDEKRICKYFDPKTNACFKGSHCKLEHTTILKDGWTKDQRAVKIDIFSRLPAPKVGKRLNLFVRHVNDVDRFYGQVIPKNCTNAEDLPAVRIFLKMNTPEIKSKYKKLLQPPAEFELVFALFQGDWYRAKIVKKYSNNNYQVFYVDYGNCFTICINEMRRWEDEFDCYPFQAIECKLDNVIKLKIKDSIAICFFREMVMEKSVIATVTSNLGPLLVTLRTDGFDVGEQLIAANFAKFKEITLFEEHNVGYPG